MKCHNMVLQTSPEGRIFLRPCGQCLACKVNDTRDWFVRAFFESKKKERPFQYFITLTFSEEFLPKDNLCSKSELKSFLNSFNTFYGLRMRYFATSDYGGENGRAHYHALIFSTKKITHKMLERVWKKGFSYIKDMKPWNIKYTLRYTVKKTPFDSEKPGWFRLISKGFGDNCVDYYVGQEYFVIEGKKYRIPDYCKQKIGIKEKCLTYSEMSNIISDKNYKFKGTFNSFVQDRYEFNQFKRRLK